MTARPRLVRSVPYWVLVVGSVAAGAVGLWLTLDKLGVMTDRILDETATGVDVYVGQSWVGLGAILIGTGLVGLALALTLAAGASLVTRAEPAVVLAEPFDDADDETDDVIVASAPETVAVDSVTADEAALQADLGATSDEQIAPPKS